MSYPYNKVGLAQCTTACQYCCKALGDITYCGSEEECQETLGVGLCVGIVVLAVFVFLAATIGLYFGFRNRDISK